MTARITVVGSANMDLVVRTPRMPAPGETLLGGPFATFPGGKGANQAVAAARLGAAVTMLGAIGADDFGEALRASMEASGVRACLVQTTTPTGVALIAIDAAGENTIVVAPGANAMLDEVAIEAQRESLAADVLVAQLEVPVATIATAARLARARGTRVLLNAAPALPLPDQLLALVDILVVNRGEACALVGASSDTAPERVAQALRARGPRLVIVTLGADGALAHGAEGTFAHRGFRVDVVDTVAAGDAFVAALAVALGEGTPLVDALRFANAAGALATTRSGAQSSLPKRSEVAALLASQR
ncbi:MAG: ribokinase [Planctomycetota bacterium]